MNSVEYLVTNFHSSIGDSIETILNGKARITFVVDDENRLIGVLSEGDLLRAYLKGFLLNTSISEIMNPNPFSSSFELGKDQIVQLWLSKGIDCVPILDQKGRIKSIQTIKEALS